MDVDFNMVEQEETAYLYDSENKELEMVVIDYEEDIISWFDYLDNLEG